MRIVGNMSGCYSPMGKTFILVDEDGTELTGVCVEQETIFTATDNDVRLGSVYAGDSGVSTGSKVIPSYNTTEGIKVVPAGGNLEITFYNGNLYDYTKFQAIICAFNSSLADSVSAEKVAIDSNVYAVQSTEVLSSITIDDATKTIQFGITNNTESPVIIRYLTYKEIY